MIRHIFLNKTNSIIKGNKSNLGLNPIMKLNYGKNISRGLIYFDTSKIEEMVKNCEINLDKASFTLKMTNCMSIDSVPYEKIILSNIQGETKRASSFDLILYKLPQSFDAGRGYDFFSDFWITDKKSYSEDASNWYFSKNGLVWESDKNKVNLEENNINWSTIIHDKNLEGGIYSSKYINEQYELFKNGKDSIILSEQHFDFGAENLSMDITPYITDIINNDMPNYGLCLSFAPNIENISDEINHYVGFFTDNTNTFYHPYVEINSNEYINDSRNNFINGIPNKLYFYVSIDGKPYNLDKMPTCTINNVDYPTVQEGYGIYYALIEPLKNVEDYEILYDKWSNLSINGIKMDDIELEFVVKPMNNKINIGYTSNKFNRPIPNIFGINDNEILQRGEVRKLFLDIREEFSTFKKTIPFNAEYRLYVKDGNKNREYDVISYEKMDKIENFLTFNIFTEDLIPNNYYIDIKLSNNMGTFYYKNILQFIIANKIKEKYD